MVTARVLAGVASARVLRIADLEPLVLDGGARFGVPLASDNIRRNRHSLGGGLHEVTALSSGFWCTECVITRRGGVIQEINRSSVRELERYCRVEARGTAEPAPRRVELPPRERLLL